MSAIEERKALDKLSASYRRLIAGGKVPPPEIPPVAKPGQLPTPPQPAQPAAAAPPP